MPRPRRGDYDLMRYDNNQGGAPVSELGRRMPRLRAEPAIEVASVDELLALATAMEQEAARRYRQMADRMRLQGESDLAALFIFLAGIEDKHAALIADRATRATGHVPEVGPIRWELPEKFEEEEGRSYLLTPYRALAIAVRNEDRAFAFYSYLAAKAETPAIRQVAEDLAKDELDHAALLRRERRKAWRIERHEVPEEPENLGSFLARVAAIESYTAKAHRALSARLAGQGHRFEARLFEDAAHDEELCAEEAAARGAGPTQRFTGGPPETIRDGLRLLEYAFNQYVEIAERTRDEAVMNAAQEFEARALKRLSYVRGAIDSSLLGPEE